MNNRSKAEPHLSYLSYLRSFIITGLFIGILAFGFFVDIPRAIGGPGCECGAMDSWTEPCPTGYSGDVQYWWTCTYAIEQPGLGGGIACIGYYNFDFSGCSKIDDTTPPPPPLPPSVSLSSPDVESTPPDTDTAASGLQADVKLTWSSSNADSCSASSNPSLSAWNGYKGTSGTQTLKLSGGTYSFSLACSGEGGDSTASASTKVVSLDLWGQDSVYKPDSFYLDWATHHILSPLTKSSSPSNPQWQGLASSSSPDGSRMSALLDSELFARGTTTFSLTGTGLTKTVTDTHRIRFYEIPRCSFSANPSRIILPNQSTLSWTCKYANSCSIDNGIGAVSPTSGSTTVRPPRTTTYTLSCMGPDGGNSFNTTVSVGFHGRIREIFPLKLEDPANLLAQAMRAVDAFLGLGR